MIRLALLVVVGLLAGCAALPGGSGGNGGDMLSQARGEEENQRLHTELVRKMIDNERLYAALAHLDAQEKEYGATPELRLLRAEVLRKLGRTSEAETLYNELIDEGAFRGRAEHGLGLIDASHDLAAGIGHLEKAAELRPTDARIRNDLGYALMKRGRSEDARLHLATAYQLDDSGNLSRNNYIVALLLDGQKTKAARIAAEANLQKETMERLRKRAAELEKTAERAPTTASVPEAPRIGAGGG